MDGIGIIFSFYLGAYSIPWLWRVFARLNGIAPFSCPQGPRFALGVTLAICHVALWIVVLRFGPSEVIAGGGMLLLFVVALTTTLALASTVLSALGVDVVTDGIERNNAAARLAGVGMWVAVAICAVGASIGEDNFFVPVFFLAGPLLLLAVAATVSRATRGFYPIGVEHDLPAGVRFAALMLACSMPLARAGAGNSAEADSIALAFFRQIPAIATLAALAVWFERRLQSPPRGMEFSREAQMVHPPIMFLAIGLAASFVPK